MRALGAGLVYFAAVFAAGFVLGTVRTVFLVPQFGAFMAVLMELPVILAIAWWACGWIIKRVRLPEDFASRAVMGASAFVLLILAEAGLAAALQGQTIRDFAATLILPAGAAGLAGQIIFALFPVIRLNRPSI